MSGQTCARGEIWLVNFNPGWGSEQQGIRPVLILQNDIGNEYAATTIVAAVVSASKTYPITVLLDRMESGLKQASMVNLAQLLSVDKSRLLRRIGHVGNESMLQVDKAIGISLGLHSST